MHLIKLHELLSKIPNQGLARQSKGKGKYIGKLWNGNGKLNKKLSIK